MDRLHSYPPSICGSACSSISSFSPKIKSTSATALIHFINPQYTLSRLQPVGLALSRALGGHVECGTPSTAGFCPSAHSAFTCVYITRSIVTYLHQGF